MKNDQQSTNLIDKWLHQTLGNYCPEAPGDAWQKLAPYLSRNKRRRPVALWIFAAAIGSTAIIALFWLLINSETPLVKPIPLEKIKHTTHTTPIILQRSFERKKVAISNSKSVSMTTVHFSKNQFSGKNSRLTMPNLPQNLNDVTDILKMKHADRLGYAENIVPSQIGHLPEKQLPIRSLTSLSLPENLLSVSQFSSPSVLPKKIKTSRFWFGVEVAPVFFVQKNTGETAAGLAFHETYARHGHGWQAGVTLAAEPLKNWRVALGIQHLRQTREAAHSATLRLMDGVCLNPHDPGLKEYEFRYAVVSDREQSDLTLRLQQQDIGSTMPDDEPFTLEMKTVHRLAAWRVPLTVERRFGRGKWQGFVRGGAAVDFSEKGAVQVTHFTEACQDLCFQSDHHPEIDASNPNRTSIGWLAGAGIERKVAHRTILRFEPFLVGRKGSVQYGLNFGILFSN